MDKRDKKDEKILRELVLNSRIPLNQLAKKVGLSREVVNYRIGNLIKKKIIKDFYAVIDVEKLGFSRAGCLFQLKGISKEKEMDFLEYLIGHDNINYASPVLGRWNFAFDLLFKDKNELSRTVGEIKNKFGKYLDNFIIISNDLEQEVFPAKIFGSNFEEKIIKNESRVRIDESDLKILKLLSKNSRIEYSELSKKLKLSANAIKYRIRNMEKSGIILNYTISVDVKKLGYEWYNIEKK